MAASKNIQTKNNISHRRLCGPIFQKYMKNTLIISTYNRPDALLLCLKSVFRQSIVPDEIIIGDDGSDNRTAEVIRSLAEKSGMELKHIWHEDRGFRLAMMRNKCIAAATGDYIIEIDGDVILHRNFISDHLSFARKGFYVKGGRVNLGKRLTQRLCQQGEYRSLHALCPGIANKRENALHIPLFARYLAPRYRRNKESALGCNMSFFKEDLIAVNGYDEFFEGWGGEDGDLGRRLQTYGLKKRHLKFAGIVFHLWHLDKYMQNKEKNIAYSQRPSVTVYCENGIDKYLK